MDIHRITTPEDRLQFEKIESVAFVSPFDVSTYEYKPSNSPAEVWGSGTPITSALVVHPFDTWFDGHLVKTTGIGGVASLPEGRGKGGIREIFAALLPAWRENGCVFSSLYPFSHRFYRQFGYELVQRGHRYTVPMEALKEFSCSDEVTMITEPDSILELHRTFTAMNNLSICRKDSQWHPLRRDPYKTLTYTYRIGDRAYVTFKKEDAKPGHDGYTLRVLDLAYQDAAAFKAILGFLYGLRAQYDTVILPLPASLPLMELFPECYDVSLEVGANGMARIVHVARALELMRYPEASGSFCLQVEDAFLPANTGLYQVHFENGEATAVTQLPADADVQPDLALSVQTLTQMVLGALTFDQALWKSDVTCYGNSALLRTVFVKKDIYFTDGF